MADSTTTAASEPSMEEILASIRKIIADDKPAEGAAGEESKDILELTQMVQDDGSVVDLNAPPPAPPPPEPVVAPMSMPPSTDGLASEQAISTAASALAALANTAKIERMAALPGGSMPLGNGMRTLEDMVTESMRPMLKEWLDQNLPSMVERIVQKEVERITKRVD